MPSVYCRLVIFKSECTENHDLETYSFGKGPSTAGKQAICLDWYGIKADSLPSIIHLGHLARAIGRHFYAREKGINNLFVSY